MPTDLPPDYKPKPVDDPGDPADPAVPGAVPAFPPVGGDDALDPTGTPRPGTDVVDPPGWSVPFSPFPPRRPSSFKFSAMGSPPPDRRQLLGLLHLQLNPIVRRPNLDSAPAPRVKQK